MFRRRLTFAFIGLVLVTLLQGGLAWWSARVAAYHVEEGHVANDMLTAYVELSANKQRLKVWYAQFILAQDADPAIRDQLLARMAETTLRLRVLAHRDEQLHGSTLFSDTPFVREDEHLRTLDAIDANLAALREGILAAGSVSEYASRAQIWREMLQRFDLSEGRDMRVLINAAIERQAAAGRAAQTAANRTLRRVDIAVVLTMSFTAVIGLALVLYFGHRLRAPLDALVRGAQALKEGRLTHRIVLATPDEFGAVAESFNAMASDLEAHRRQDDLTRASLEAAVAFRTRELSDANRLLQQLDLRRCQFFVEVSHELRTPVTVIRGEAEIALRGPDKSAPEYRDALGRVVGAALDLGMRVEDLLDLARVESQTRVLELRSAGLERVVADAVDAMRPTASEQGVRLLALAMPGSPSASIQIAVDLPRFRQLLTILFDNAVRYSASGDTVAVTCEACVDSDTVRICVEDQGIGIEPQDLPHVFERGFRSPQARRVRPDGLGLGLTIGRALALAHGGRLTLAPGEAGGCIACVELPRADTVRHATTATTARTAPGRGNAQPAQEDMA